MKKISIRLFGDREVRAVWDDESPKKWFSAKLKLGGNQLGSVTTQFKIAAPDERRHAANVLDYDDIVEGEDGQ
jgi:cell filamentation protein